MLKLLATTENQKLIILEENNQNCVRKSVYSKIAVRNFTAINNSSRAVLFLIESNAKSYESFIVGRERILIGRADE